MFYFSSKRRSRSGQLIIFLLSTAVTLSLHSRQVLAQAPPPSPASPTQPSPTQPSPTQPAAEKKNILIIHSYALHFDWTAQLKTGIDEGFKESKQDLAIYHEFIDAKRYPDLHYAQDFLGYIEKKYADTPLEVVMVSDDPGLDLILENRDRYLADIPIVFFGINRFRPEVFDTPWITGVFETRKPIETVLEAKRQTGSDNLIVITDSTATGKANMKRLEPLSDEPDAPSNIVLIEDLASTAIAQEIGPYPDDWPIFFAGQIRQDSSDGPLMNPEKDAALLHAQVPNLIYTDTLPRVGNGAIGGKVLYGKYHGRQAVELVAQFLEGTPIEDIEPLMESDNKWIFDARELKRARIRESQLPSETLLVNEIPSFYEQYRFLVWITAISFSLGLITIVVLSNAVRRQKRAEKHLRESERKLEQNVVKRTAELSEALTELKQTQAQLIQTEKLSSLGQLVGGIAHEFNNPLSFVYSNLKHIESYINNLLGLVNLYQTPSVQPQAIETYIEEIELDYIQQDTPNLIKSMKLGADRIQGIVRELQKFSRSDEQGIKPTDLNQCLDSALLILDTQLGSDIAVVKDYTTLPLVHCKPGDFNQIVMNILLNAVAALKEANAVSDKTITIKTRLPKKNWVEISIEDNGVGIPEDIQGKVFDPFFTTKPIGKGTGLGLALCYQVVQQHNGELLLSSALGKGTKLQIGLPVR
ncbi:MAG: ATP-binding protein [Phormidesmis sp.]